jgi:DegV family protein with EDD domain
MRTGKRYIKVQDRRKDLFKIKQVAEILQTTPRTIRYYEQRGVLPPVKRTHGQMRLYTQTDIDILRQAKELQTRGKSLDEIKAELTRVQRSVLLNRESNKIKILVDSTASLPFDLARQNNIEIIPLHIKLGESDVLDGIDITAEQLRQRVEEGRLIPLSAPPTEEEFISMYTHLYEAGAEHIISLHLSEKISDTVKIARKAASYIKDFKVTVVDAGTMSAGAALMAFAGAATIASGAGVEDVLAEIDTVRQKQAEAVAVCSTEKVLGKEKDSPLLQMIVDFKPLLIIEDGKLTLYKKSRTMPELEDQLVAFCREKKNLSHIIVLQANMPAAAASLLSRLEKLFRNVPGIIFPYSAVASANLGNDLLGLALS